MQKNNFIKKKLQQKEQEEILNVQDECKEVKEKKTKECGFINVTDPTLRNTIIDVSKCPGDATNFTFWFQKSDETHWGLTIKSMPKNSESDYEKKKGMIFHSQHTWKITWYNDVDTLRVANHSKSLAEDITGNDYLSIKKIYNLYKALK